MTDPAYEQALQGLKAEIRDLSAKLAEVQYKIVSLEQQSRASTRLNKAVANAGMPLIEPMQQQTADASPDDAIPPAHVVIPPPVIRPVPPVAPAASNVSQDRPFAPVSPAARSAEPGAVPASQGLEVLIGGTWFNRIGALVLMLGIAFFVKYSFEQGWIGPMARVLSGAAVGVLLIAVGEYCLFRKLGNFAVGMLATGIVALYVSAYAAHQFYHLISLDLAFGLFCVITLIAAVISVQSRIMTIAVMGLLGGFWTPFALSSGENHQIALMTYLCVLDVGFLLVGMIRGWNALRHIAWVGTCVLFLSWCFAYYDHRDFVAFQTTASFATLYYALFHLESLFSVARTPQNSAAGRNVLLHANNAAYFGMIYALSEMHFTEYRGVFCLALVAWNWLSAWSILRINPASATMQTSLWIDGAWLLALFAPVQFNHAVVTIAWALQSLATFAMARRMRAGWLVAKGALVFIAAAAHLFAVDYYDPALQPILLGIGHAFVNALSLLAYGLAAIGWVAALLLMKPDAQGAARFFRLVVLVVGCLVVLCITAMQQERAIATYHWAMLTGVWMLLAWRRSDVSPLALGLAALTFVKYMHRDLAMTATSPEFANDVRMILNDTVGAGVAVTLILMLLPHIVKRLPESDILPDASRTALTHIVRLCAALTVMAFGTFEIVRIFQHEPWGHSFQNPERAMQVALSVFWATHASVLLTVGFIRLLQPLRIMSMLIFAGTIIKVMTVDLSHLMTLYRVISFIALGVLLLLASYLYQKLAMRISHGSS